MAEYIERESLEQDIKQYSHARIDNDAIDQMGFQFVEEMISILRIVEKQPAADVVEVKHSAWGHKYSLHKIVCLNCGTPRPYQKTKRGYHLAWNSNFCPNCGAKMDLKEGVENEAD